MVSSSQVSLTKSLNFQVVAATCGTSKGNFKTPSVEVVYFFIIQQSTCRPAGSGGLQNKVISVFIVVKSTCVCDKTAMKSSAMMCCWVLITLMYTPLLSTHINPHLQMISIQLSMAFCEMYTKTPPDCRASTHRSLHRFNNHFLCLAARGVWVVRGQMCSTLNTLKAKARSTDLFLQSKQHQSC